MISGFADRLHNRSGGRNLIDGLGIYGKELKTLFCKAGCGFRMENLFLFCYYPVLAYEPGILIGFFFSLLGHDGVRMHFFFSKHHIKVVLSPKLELGLVGCRTLTLPPVVTMVMTLSLGYMTESSTSPSGTPERGSGRILLTFFLANGCGLWREHHLLYRTVSMFTT